MEKRCDRCKIDCSMYYTNTLRAEGNEVRVVKTLCGDCSHDDHMAEYRKTGKLSNNVIMPANFYVNDVGYTTGGKDGGWVEWMRGDDRLHQRNEIRRRIKERANFADDYKKIVNEYEKVRAAIKMFERGIWFSWLQSYWKNTDVRGHKSSVQDLEMLLWGCAGRAVMTLQDKNSSVTVITDESSSTSAMGMQGIDATCDETLKLLTIAFDRSNDLHVNIKPDGKVSFI